MTQNSELWRGSNVEVTLFTGEIVKGTFIRRTPNNLVILVNGKRRCIIRTFEVLYINSLNP